MFYMIRYQTGELDLVAKDMKAGLIPCMDVADMDEFRWVVKQLANYGIALDETVPLDKNARDRVKEPEFEFRAAFLPIPENSGSQDAHRHMYIDFYFEPEPEKTYDSIGEI